MQFTDDELFELESGTQRIGVFLRIDTTPPICLWSGSAHVNPGVNSVDAVSRVYTGMGAGGIVDMPAVQQLMNGTAERVVFRLSSVNPDVLALAVAGSPDVKRRDVHLGFCVMDSAWRVIAPVHWFWRGIADFLSVATQAPREDSPSMQAVHTISLSVGSIFTGRNRRGLSYWTSDDQARRTSA